jgi:hypothetical protein
MRTHAAPRARREFPRNWRLETHDPDDVPIEPPYEDPEDPDLLPEEDDEYPLPGEDDEYASPGVEPLEDPLVAP